MVCFNGLFEISILLCLLSLSRPSRPSRLSTLSCLLWLSCCSLGGAEKFSSPISLLSVIIKRFAINEAWLTNSICFTNGWIWIRRFKPNNFIRWFALLDCLRYRSYCAYRPIHDHPDFRAFHAFRAFRALLCCLSAELTIFLPPIPLLSVYKEFVINATFLTNSWCFTGTWWI